MILVSLVCVCCVCACVSVCVVDDRFIISSIKTSSFCSTYTVINSWINGSKLPNRGYHCLQFVYCIFSTTFIIALPNLSTAVSIAVYTAVSTVVGTAFITVVYTTAATTVVNTASHPEGSISPAIDAES